MSEVNNSIVWRASDIVKNRNVMMSDDPFVRLYDYEIVQTQLEMLTADHRIKLAMISFSKLSDDHKKLIMQLISLLTQIKDTKE